MQRPDEKPIKLERKRLDPAELEAHLRTLAAEAQAIEVRVKDAVAHHSEATSDPLDVVGRRLLAGEIIAVQIRFLLGEEWWCDTLMHAERGFRLVRMREESPPGSR